MATPNGSKLRFRAGLPAVVRIDGKVCDAVAEELGRTGVSLYGDLPLPETDTIEVTIRSTAGDLLLSVSGHVAHAKRDDKTQETHVGLELNALTAEQQQVLDDLVSRVAEGMNPAALQALPPGAGPDLVQKALASVPPSRSPLSMST